MWCIGALTEEYRQRMYDVLELYARPYRKNEPVICIDEKSKQLLRDSRAPLIRKPGVPAKYDYEYVRAGTCNVFVAVEPKGGRRVLEVTERRTTPEFVGFVRHLLERTYLHCVIKQGIMSASSRDLGGAPWVTVWNHGSNAIRM